MNKVILPHHDACKCSICETYKDTQMKVIAYSMLIGLALLLVVGLVCKIFNLTGWDN